MTVSPHSFQAGAWQPSFSTSTPRRTLRRPLPRVAILKNTAGFDHFSPRLLAAFTISFTMRRVAAFANVFENLSTSFEQLCSNFGIFTYFRSGTNFEVREDADVVTLRPLLPEPALLFAKPFWNSDSAFGSSVDHLLVEAANCRNAVERRSASFNPRSNCFSCWAKKARKKKNGFMIQILFPASAAKYDLSLFSIGVEVRLIYFFNVC